MKLIIFPFLFILLFCSHKQSNADLKNSSDYKRGLEILNGPKPDKKEALAAFDKELQVHPNNGYAYTYKAIIYDSEGKYEEALAAFADAIDNLTEDKKWLSSTYALRADVYVKMNKGEEALKDWEISLQLNPTDPETYSQRGEFYLQRKQYNLADADCCNIIELTPNVPIGYLRMARVSIARANYAEVISRADSCIKRFPDCSEAYTIRALAYKFLNDNDKLTSDIATALLIDQNHNAFQMLSILNQAQKNMLIGKLQALENKVGKPTGLSNYVALLYERSGKFAKAIHYYKRLNSIRTYSVALQRISYCYKEMGMYERALSYINKAMAMEDAELSCLGDKSELLYEMEQYDEAEKMASKLINQTPTIPHTLFVRGIIRETLGNLNGAIADYTACIKHNPNMSKAYLHRGNVYKRMGKKEKGNADFYKTIQLDTVCGEDNSAQFAYLYLGEINKAMVFENKILAQSSSKENLYNAARLYAMIGKNDKVLFLLNQAFRKGFSRLGLIQTEICFKHIKNNPQFKRLLKQQEQQIKAKSNIRFS